MMFVACRFKERDVKGGNMRKIRLLESLARRNTQKNFYAGRDERLRTTTYDTYDRPQPCPFGP